VFVQFEAFGFCGPGEARNFIAGAKVDIDDKSRNFNGGRLGEAYIHGMNLSTEAVPAVGPHRGQRG
jgi:hypothetical protein